jgi:hypothetical protein
VASLGVPHSYRASLLALAGADENVVAALVSQLDALPAYAPVTDVRRVITTSLAPDQSEGDAASEGLAAALLSLRGLFRTLSAEEIGESLASSTDLDLDAESRRRLAQRVAAFLKSPALSTTAVAVDLQTQHERNYQSARIFTDVRPVFDEDVDQGPTGAVIVEMLQLQTWNRDGRAETIFVALDEKDLMQLQDVVDRARKKTATLRKFLDEKELAYFRLEEDE